MGWDLGVSVKKSSGLCILYDARILFFLFCHRDNIELGRLCYCFYASVNRLTFPGHGHCLERKEKRLKTTYTLSSSSSRRHQSKNILHESYGLVYFFPSFPPPPLTSFLRIIDVVCRLPLPSCDKLLQYNTVRVHVCCGIIFTQKKTLHL